MSLSLLSSSSVQFTSVWNSTWVDAKWKKFFLLDFVFFIVQWAGSPFIYSSVRWLFGSVMAVFVPNQETRALSMWATQWSGGDLWWYLWWMVPRETSLFFDVGLEWVASFEDYLGWYVPIFYFTSHPLALSLFFEKKLKAASLLRICSPMSGLGVWAFYHHFLATQDTWWFSWDD